MNNITVIRFPNLGTGQLTLEMNRTAFRIGSLSIQWYAIIITIGIICAFAYFTYRAKKSGFTTDDCLDYTIYAVIFGVIGARLFYVLTNLNEYKSFLDVIAVWNGGLAIYGGIIAGAITMIVVSRIKKKNALAALDCVSGAVLIGQMIGRWGNFVNGEAYGSVVEYSFFGATFKTSAAKSFPWLMEVSHKTVDAAGNITASDTPYIYQPTFLYESLWNLIGFLIINRIFKNKKYHGQILLCYLAWYGLGRMFIEGMRTDSLMIGSIRISQLIGLLCFLICTTLIIYNRIKRAKKLAHGEDTTTILVNDIGSGVEYGEKKEISLSDIDLEIKMDEEVLKKDNMQDKIEKEKEESKAETEEGSASIEEDEKKELKENGESN